MRLHKLTLIHYIFAGILSGIGLMIYFGPIFMDSFSHIDVINGIREILLAEKTFYENRKFLATSAADLDLDIQPVFSLEALPNAVFVTFIPSDKYAYRDHGLFRMWRSPHIRSYVGAIFANSEKDTSTIICALNKPSRAKPSLPVLQEGVPVCGEGTFAIPDTVKRLYIFFYAMPRQNSHFPE